MTSHPVRSARRRPRIALIATGGTIAGYAPDAAQTTAYQAGALGVEAILTPLSQLANIADIKAEQLSNIDSKNITDALWIALARRVNTLASCGEVDGVVITHGTDTLEETAFWLALTTECSIPVVLTAAMRPATALSADGPLNLLDAVTVAAATSARGRGVLVVFAQQIHRARDVTKNSTYLATAFSSGESGLTGWVQDGRVDFVQPASIGDGGDGASQKAEVSKLHVYPWHSGRSPFPGAVPPSLPRVEIIVSHAGASRSLVDAVVATGARGIVVAGVGHGALHEELQHGLVDAVKQGIPVVRATRVAYGRVLRVTASSDSAFGFIASGRLNPYKARVLLALALAWDVDLGDGLRRLFDRF